MGFRIARDGQTFGPYTEGEVHQYIASGNIVPTDRAQAEGTSEWLSVESVFPSAGVPPPPANGMPPGPSGALFPDPPDLPWWVALLLGLFTGGIFLIVWDIVQAAWLKRVQPLSNALTLYIAIAVVYLIRLPASWATIHYNLFSGPPVGPHHGFLLFLVWLGLYLASRTVIRQDLLRHFNGPEAIGLRLNALLVYLLGGLYLQYHFNRINELKRAYHVSVPSL